MNDGYDLIVVGAGIVGLAHAWAGASRGLSVCVIERGAACAGASVRESGCITVTGQREGDSWRRAMRSRQVWTELAPQAGIAVVHRGLYVVAHLPAAASLLEAFMRRPSAARCELYEARDVRGALGTLSLDDASAVLYSPHELRVEPRTAVAQLAAWLAQAMGVAFRFGVFVKEVDAPRVHTSRGVLAAERVVMCPGADLNAWVAQHELDRCQSQHLRVQPEPGFRLPGAVMNDLSLLRFAGYSELPQAQALRAQLEDEEAACLADGVHLQAVQSADGSLVVGGSQRCGSAMAPFIDAQVDEQVLRQLRSTLDLEQAQVTERWLCPQPSSATVDCLIEPPNDATRVVVVANGCDLSTAFGVAEDVFADW